MNYYLQYIDMILLLLLFFSKKSYYYYVTTKSVHNITGTVRPCYRARGGGASETLSCTILQCSKNPGTLFLAAFTNIKYTIEKNFDHLFITL